MSSLNVAITLKCTNIWAGIKEKSWEKMHKCDNERDNNHSKHSSIVRNPNMHELYRDYLDTM